MRRLLLLTPLLLLAACGGSSSLSQQQFVAQADAACQRSSADLARLPQPTGGDLASLASYTQGVLSAYAGSLDQVAGLAARARDRDELEAQWIRPLQQQLGRARPLLQQLTTAARAGDRTAVGAASAKLAALPDATAGVESFQRSYGARDCAALLASLRG